LAQKEDKKATRLNLYLHSTIKLERILNYNLPNVRRYYSESQFEAIESKPAVCNSGKEITGVFFVRRNEQNQAYMEASKRGWDFHHLITMTEQNEWIFEDNDRVKGPSMVCDVFVTEMWKAAGMFKPELVNLIQATEFTNWDAYSLNSQSSILITSVLLSMWKQIPIPNG